MLYDYRQTVAKRNVKEMKKPDRRTLYTKMVIKDAFLELSKTVPYNAISISDICRVAEISRSTFYIHYGNVRDVLGEVIDDALQNVGNLMQQFSQQKEEPDSCNIPLCVAIRSQEKYHSIFLDESLSSILIEKISGAFYGELYTLLKKDSTLSDDELKTLSFFQLSGCFAVCRRNLKVENDEWSEKKCLLDRFIGGGIKALTKR